MFQRMTLHPLSMLAGLALLTVSCQETDIQGALKENRPPKTYLTLDGVDRSDDNRLNSQVRIRWWGDDPDGFITGYEFNINNTGWQYTTTTDSVFVLPIPTGNATADVLFSIRAIDNQDAKDPNPPSLTFPIVNSNPDIRFNSVEQPSDTTFHVFSFGWSASDPDGALNLDHTEIAINDTVDGWVTMPDGVTFVTVNVGDGSGATATGQIFLGKSYVSSALTLPGIVMNGENTFYVRAVDQAGARSAIERKTWYVKRQTSRVLVVNDDASPNTQTRLNNHLTWLAQSGITAVDVMQATDGTATGGFKAPLSAAFQKTLDPTMNKTFAKWDYIYWVSENLDRNITYALEMTVDFFREGGKMYINIPTKTLPSTDPVFTFLPFDRLGVPGITGAQGFLIQSNTALTPVDVPSAPSGRIGSANITGVSPLVPSGGSKVLYNAVFRVRQLIGSQLYTGNPVIAVLGADGNMAYLGLDAASINPADIQPMIRFIVIDQLGFQN